MMSLAASTPSIQATYLAFNRACCNINTELKSSLTLRRHCNSGPSTMTIPRGGGGYSGFFHKYVGSDHLLGVKFLNFNIWGSLRK